MTQPQEFPEPHEGIDPYNNQEAKARDRDGAPRTARGGAGVAAESGPAPADEQPSQSIPGGTAGGDPLSGVGISEQDLDEAVPGDTGVELPGERRG